MHSEIEKQAANLVPLLLRTASETEEKRQIPGEVAAALKATDLLRLYQPKRFGGLELPYGTLQLSISTLLGAACASTAWVQAGIAVHSWLVQHFPERARLAVWGSRPESLICTAVTPKDGKARPVDGGYVLDGTWQFSSGCSLCDWVVVRASVPGIDGKEVPLLFLVKMSEVEVVDVWHAVGLRGTGSNDIKLKDLFVHADFTTSMFELRGENRTIAPLYGLPYMTLFPFTVGAPALGAARGALEYYLQEGRNSPSRAASPGRLQSFAAASAEVSTAEHFLGEAASLMDAYSSRHERMSTVERVKCRINTAAAAHLCRRAVGRLVGTLGAHGVQQAHPVQRAFRDIIAITSHIALNKEAAAELYSRVHFDLPISDPFL